MGSTIRCPECLSEVSIQPPRAGRYRIACPKCPATLVVTVPEGPGALPAVAILRADPSKLDAIPPDGPNLAGTPIPRHRPTPASAPVIRASAAPTDIPAASPFPVPRWLGGYRVGLPAGPSRVGAMFEATRRATGRPSSLVVVRPGWSSLPTFVARFAREAYAAEHLDHPNLFPPNDLGIDRGLAFAASDAPLGVALSDPRGREGFDRSARVAAILQAARALRHAHEQGVYHRDLSLGQIRGDGAGLIQLAGVGVNLTPQTPEGPDAAPTSMAGSPPAPASTGPVAARAIRDDLAGLGRALQSLIGGERGDRATTLGLATVVRRLLGEGPEAPFADAGAVVRALEAELGVVGPFLPTEAEAADLEASARNFDDAPLGQLRPLVSGGIVALLGIFAALGVLAGRPLSAVGALAFGAIIGAATLAIRARFAPGPDPIVNRVRELVLGGTRGDLGTVALAALILIGALAATGLLGFWVFLAALAVGLAVARHYALDRPVALARAEPIEKATALIRSLRRRGVDEASVRRFACQQAGPRWEEFFEALFGDEALRSARALWGPDAGGRRRPRFARWRDPIVGALDARLRARREARDLDLFRGIEERNLEARGVNLLTARRKSRRVAEAIVTYARAYRQGGSDAPGAPLMDGLDRVARRPDDYLTAAEVEEPAGPSVAFETLDAIARVLFGPRTRFLLGGVALAGFLLWMHQNSLISAEEIRRAGARAVEGREEAVQNVQTISREIASKVQKVADAATQTRSLEVEGLPPGLARRLDGFGLGVAGLLLVASSFFGGIRMAAFALPGALVAAIGPGLVEPGARTLGPASLACLAAAAGILALGLAFGRSR